jgi:hypothetical protein
VNNLLLDSYFVLLLCTLTSLGGVAWGVRRHGLRREALAMAIGRSFEWVGLFLVCLMLNIGIGTALSLTLRALAPDVFVSPYLSTDLTLALLTALQAATFQWWRHTA